MPKAKPSTKVLRKVTLICALLNVPVAIYNGHNDQYKGFERHLWLPVEKTEGKGKAKKKVVEFHSVGNLQYDKETGENLTLGQKDQVVSLVETENGKVHVADEEIYEALNLDPNSLNVLSFQPLALFASNDHYFPKKLMFVEPAKVDGKGGRKVIAPRAAQTLSAFLRQMQDKGVMAVCELTTGDLPKPCVLLPDGRLIQVQHTEALREQRAISDLVTEEPIEPKTKALLDQLIDEMTTDEPSDLEDKKSALVLAFANQKAEEGDFSIPDTEAEVEPVLQDIGEDFADVLQRSIDDAKKATKKKASA